MPDPNLDYSKRFLAPNETQADKDQRLQAINAMLKNEYGDGLWLTDLEGKPVQAGYFPADPSRKDVLVTIAKIQPYVTADDTFCHCRVDLACDEWEDYEKQHRLVKERPDKIIQKLKKLYPNAQIPVVEDYIPAEPVRHAVAKKMTKLRPNSPYRGDVLTANAQPYARRKNGAIPLHARFELFSYNSYNLWLTSMSNKKMLVAKAAGDPTGVQKEVSISMIRPIVSCSGRICRSRVYTEDTSIFGKRGKTYEVMETPDEIQNLYPAVLNQKVPPIGAPVKQNKVVRALYALTQKMFYSRFSPLPKFFPQFPQKLQALNEGRMFYKTNPVKTAFLAAVATICVVAASMPVNTPDPMAIAPASSEPNVSQPNSVPQIEMPTRTQDGRTITRDRPLTR